MEPRLLHTVPQIEYEKLLVERDALKAENAKLRDMVSELMFGEMGRLRAVAEIARRMTVINPHPETQRMNDIAADMILAIAALDALDNGK